MARKLVVEIVGDASSLDRAFKKSEKSAKHFNTQMGQMGRGTVAVSGIFGAFSRRVAFASGSFLGAAGLTAAVKSSVSAASDLEQQIGKTNVVFGKSGREVIAWSKTLAASFGLSQREALTTASDLGALFAPIGLTGAAAAEQSKKLTELGADLASFYNTDVASALDALRSGLVGESEPLRKYGVLLSETRVQQEALNETGKKSATQLTDQEKVLARIALIYKDSQKAQGDFARTSDDLSQQTKILKANIENLKVELGSALIPVLNDVVTALNDFFVALSGGPVEGAVKGQGVETTLVPVLAKRIAALKKAGKSGKEIIEILRKQLGDAEKADDLIAEAFLFPRSAKLRARLRRQREGTTAVGAGGAGLSKAEREALRASTRRAAEAFRQLQQDRAAFAVERAGATKALADDLVALNKYNDLLKRRIRGGHATLELEREQFQVQQQIADVLKQQAEARAAQRQARQFRILGFGPEGEELIPGVKALQRQLAAVDDLLAGSFLDTRKTRSLISHIAKVLSGSLGKVGDEVRARIQQILADLKQQLKQSSVDVTRFQKTARGQFALAGAAGGARGVVITGGVHLHGVRNVEQMERELQKRRRQRAAQRRSKR